MMVSLFIMQNSYATWFRVASAVAAFLALSLSDASAQAPPAGPYVYQIDIVGGSIAQRGTVVPITPV